MNIDYIALFLFTFVTTYTPGPNTVSSAMMGMQFGYQKSLRYFFGIATGFFSIMFCCALFAGALKQLVPEAVKILSYLGAAYILYLAIHVLRAEYKVADETSEPLKYRNGLFLQLLNPKVMVLGLTVYTSFLASMERSLPLIVVSALFLTCMSFSALSVWAFFGAAFSRVCANNKIRWIVNIVLAVLLAYSAIGVLRIQA